MSNVAATCSPILRRQSVGSRVRTPMTRCATLLFVCRRRPLNSSAGPAMHSEPETLSSRSRSTNLTIFSTTFITATSSTSSRTPGVENSIRSRRCSWRLSAGSTSASATTPRTSASGSATSSTVGRRKHKRRSEPRLDSRASMRHR